MTAPYVRRLGGDFGAAAAYRWARATSSAPVHFDAARGLPPEGMEPEGSST